MTSGLRRPWQTPYRAAGGIAEYDITVTNFLAQPMAMHGDTVLIADEDLSKIDPFVTEFLPIDPLARTYTFDPVGGAVYGGGYGLPDNGLAAAETTLSWG